MVGVSAGSTLRRYRDECGYTQEALAEAVGVSWSSVAQWESGRITPRRKTAERVDQTLSAGGALLAAFGYAGRPVSSSDDSVDQLRARVAELTERVERLAELVAQHDGQLASLANRGGKARRQSAQVH